jgi:predicted CopG family antitoxin
MPTKTINEAFDEEQYSELKAVKGDRTWSEAILQEFGVSND